MHFGRRVSVGTMRAMRSWESRDRVCAPRTRNDGKQLFHSQKPAKSPAQFVLSKKLEDQ